VLPAATDIVETVLGDSYVKELQKISLADNTVGRIMSDIQKTYVVYSLINLKYHLLHCK